MKIFVTRVIPQAGLDILRQTPNLEVEVWPETMPPDKATLLKKIQGIAGLYCLITETIDEELLQAAGPQLKVISQMAVGVDNINLTACTKRGIPVGHTPGVLSEATADLTLALMLATARQLLPAATAIKAGQWLTWEPEGFIGPDLYGSTVGLIGLGRIGAAVARRLQGFKVRLLYHNRHPSPIAEEIGATYVDLATLLKESDFVSLHCPATPETHHLMNLERFRLMKPTAILINTARGSVVNQTELITALEEGLIAYAGLDVTTPEPLPADHPLLSLPNVLVLPHIGSASLSARTRMATIAAENLLAGLRDEQLPHCVNPEVYGDR